MGWMMVAAARARACVCVAQGGGFTARVLGTVLIGHGFSRDMARRLSRHPAGQGGRPAVVGLARRG